jgi:hypothetical protein
MNSTTAAARRRGHLSRHERLQLMRAEAFSRRTPTNMPTPVSVKLGPEQRNLIEQLVRGDRTAVSSALLASCAEHGGRSRGKSDRPRERKLRACRWRRQDAAWEQKSDLRLASRLLSHRRRRGSLGVNREHGPRVDEVRDHGERVGTRHETFARDAGADHSAR